MVMVGGTVSILQQIGCDRATETATKAARANLKEFGTLHLCDDLEPNKRWDGGRIDYDIDEAGVISYKYTVTVEFVENLTISQKEFNGFGKYALKNTALVHSKTYGMEEFQKQEGKYSLFFNPEESQEADVANVTLIGEDAVALASLVLKNESGIIAFKSLEGDVDTFIGKLRLSFKTDKDECQSQ
tara:strand:- start:62 stop:619 length:558 start_codon:yes stop_codon:yes gene_type:complete